MLFNLPYKDYSFKLIQNDILYLDEYKEYLDFFFYKFHKKRQIEFISGRVALIKSLKDLNVKFNTKQLISNYQIYNFKFDNFISSISHSHKYAGALTSKNPSSIIGFDIEKIKETFNSRLAKKIFTSKELVLLKNKEVNFFQLFSLKECFYKALNTHCITYPNFQDVNFIKIDNHQFYAEVKNNILPINFSDLNFYSHIYNDYYLSFYLK